MKLSVTQKYLCDCTFNQTSTKYVGSGRFL